MGSDTRGKRELAADLMAAARIWTDDRIQASAIGECQHLPSLSGVAEIGEALASGEGRQGEEITVFDGTGLALQDLVAASHVIAAAERQGGATTVSL